MTKYLALLTVAALGVSACGDDGGGATDSAPAPSTTVAPTPAPATTPTAPPAASTTGAPAEARTAQDGDTVSVHYRGTLDDGNEFDSSEGRDPLTFVVGSGQVISGFDDAVRGLAVGESRTVRMGPEDAYGAVDPERIIEVPLADLPDGVEAGQELVTGTGQRVVVVEVTDEVARIDTNHPLAGEALTFDVELVSIEG